MKDLKKLAHLKLVKPFCDEQPRESRNDFSGQTQSELFPMGKPSLLIFVDTSDISSDIFVQLLKEARPTLVLDVRPIPRFDIGKLNRKLAFELFRENEIEYMDVAGLTGVQSRWDARLNPSFLAQSINKSLKAQRAALEGPIAVLFDNQEFLNSAAGVFPKVLLNNIRRNWEIFVTPSSSSAK